MAALTVRERPGDILGVPGTHPSWSARIQTKQKVVPQLPMATGILPVFEERHREGPFRPMIAKLDRSNRHLREEGIAFPQDKVPPPVKKTGNNYKEPSPREVERESARINKSVSMRPRAHLPVPREGFDLSYQPKSGRAHYDIIKWKGYLVEREPAVVREEKAEKARARKYGDATERAKYRPKNILEHKLAMPDSSKKKDESWQPPKWWPGGQEAGAITDRSGRTVGAASRQSERSIGALTERSSRGRIRMLPEAGQGDTKLVRKESSVANDSSASKPREREYFGAPYVKCIEPKLPQQDSTTMGVLLHNRNRFNDVQGYFKLEEAA